MNRESLKHLFQKYLHRDPRDSEYDNHLNRAITYDSFEIEIKTCKERMELLSRNSECSIALVLSGHTRNMRILETLKDYASKYSIDTFAFVWDQVGLKGSETDIEAKTDRTQIENKVQALPHLKSYTIESNAEFVTKNQASCQNIKYFNHSSPEIFIKSQLYAIKRSYMLMEEYAKKQKKKYDIVIKCRMDAHFSQFDVDDRLVFEVNDYPIIFVPNSEIEHKHPDYGTGCWACDNMYHKYGLLRPHIFEHTNVICDVFAYGSMSSMKEYCSMYDHYDRLNSSFVDENLKILSANKQIDCRVIDNVHRIEDHKESVYYFNCSYPERILSKMLKNYMLPSSTKIKMRI